jgi:uncharacterized membrane protein YhaH (DUF805 family)
MGFGDAIWAGLRKFVIFSGRAGRAEYWYWVLFSVLVIIAWTFVDILVVGISTGPFSTLVTLALILPGLAATARRLHDTDRSAWWIVLPVAPLVGVVLVLVMLAASPLLLVVAVAAALIGLVVLLLMVAAPGTPGTNRFGPEPP